MAGDAPGQKKRKAFCKVLAERTDVQDQNAKAHEALGPRVISEIAETKKRKYLKYICVISPTSYVLHCVPHHVFADMVQLLYYTTTRALLQCHVLMFKCIYGCVPHGDQLALSMQQRHKFNCPNHQFVRQLAFSRPRQ